MRAIIGIVVLLCTCSLAVGQSRFEFEYSGLSGFPSIAETYDPISGESTLDIEFTINAGGIATFTVRPSGPVRILRHLRVRANGSAGSYAFVNVGCPTPLTKSIRRVDEITPHVLSKPLIVTCTDVGQLGVLSSPAIIQGASIGAIRVLLRTDVTDYTGDAYAQMAAIAQDSIEGNIEEGVVAQGDFQGSISASNLMAHVNVTGDIGTPTQLATITAGKIAWIEADNIYATISTALPDASDFTARIEAREGDFKGSLTTQFIAPRNFGVENTCYIKTAGDLDADIIVRDSVLSVNGPNPVIDVGGTFLAGRLFRVRYDFQGPSGGNVGGMRVGDAAGLQGQVIVSAANSYGQWLGDVTVGTTTLSPKPEYTQTSASLGGGAVGLVPFSLHDEDCTQPDAGDTVLTMLNSEFCQLLDPSDNRSIVLRLYGPVRTQHPTALPVEVTRLVNGQPGAPPETALVCTVRRGTSGSASRELVLTGDGSTLLIAGTYSVKPIRGVGVDGRLLCDELGSTAEVPVSDFTFTFELQSDCNLNGVEDADEIAAEPWKDIWVVDGIIDACQECCPDWNGDGNCDQDDVAALAECVAGGACPNDPDFNRDGNVDQDDVSAMEHAVAGAGCP